MMVLALVLMMMFMNTLSISGEGEGGSECWAIQGWWKHSDTVGRCLITL